MKILLIGSIALDRIMMFAGTFQSVIQPDKLDVLSLSVLLDSLQDSPGGVAANIAYTLALLEEHPVLFGSVGESAHSYMDTLSLLGVDTTHIHYSPLSTATFTVMSDKKGCQIGGFYPGAMSDASSLSLEQFSEKDMFVVISPHDPNQMARQVTECRERKFRLFYDVGQQANTLSGENLRLGISAAELLIVNEYEMSVLTQKTGWSQDDIEKKVQTCVITLGAEGSRITAHGKKSEEVPAVHVDDVVDPTGAGDAYRAGFLYGYMKNEEVSTCAQLGSTAAAFAIEKHGTQSHRFTLEEFLERFTKNYTRSLYATKST